MDMTVAEVVQRLKGDKDYRKRFQAAFGQAASGDDVAKALASYVRTILAGDTPVDRYYFQGKGEALSPQELEGLRLFRGKARCSFCHAAPNFTDERFHNTGVAWRDSKWLDEGRYAVTKRDADRGAFKTPTLRELARTAPYMHDGSIATLEKVIEFYNRGGNKNPHLDPELRPLCLTAEEKQALLCFLKALSGTIHAAASELQQIPQERVSNNKIVFPK